MASIFTRSTINSQTFEALTYVEDGAPGMFLQEHRTLLDNWLHQFYPEMDFKSTQYVFADNVRLTKLVAAIRNETRTVWDIITEPKLLTRINELQKMIENLEELWELLETHFGFTLPEPLLT